MTCLHTDVEPDRRTAAPVVGVLGGMGPAATADFDGKLVLATPARVDHIDSTQCLAKAVVTRSSLEV